MNTLIMLTPKELAYITANTEAALQVAQHQLSAIKEHGNPNDEEDRKAFIEIKEDIVLISAILKKLSPQDKLPAEYKNYTTNAEMLEAFADFEQTRRALKKPMTHKARQMLLKKLDQLASCDADKIAIINQSIEKGWNGVFPLAAKATKKGKPEKEHSYDLEEFYQKALNSTPSFK